MASELKYTDRDVRDNESQVTEIVTDFLEDYTGEFQFLIDCKMRLAQGNELSVGMMRGVLNCMRADPRVTIDLPEPLPVEHYNVVPIKKSQRKWGPDTCDIERDHGGHYIGPESYKRRHYCSGRWTINRDPYALPAKVDLAFTGIVAKTGAMIHRLDHEAEVTWFPHPHSPGFIGGGSTYRGRYSSGSIHYKTHCKGASIIRNGILLTDTSTQVILKDRKMLDAYLEALTGTPPPPSQRKELSMCKKCWQ